MKEREIWRNPWEQHPNNLWEPCPECDKVHDPDESCMENAVNEAEYKEER